MDDAYILGIYGSDNGKFPEKDARALTRDAYLGVIADARLEDPSVIGSVWFGNMLLDHWGQSFIKGPLCMSPLVNEGLLPAGVPVTTVEGGCATGSLAFNGALRSVQAGHSDVTLAVGIEKMVDPDNPRAILKCMEGALDRMDEASWRDLYDRTAKENGTVFESGADRSVAMDLYALWAHTHMRRYGTNVQQIAAAASKNHCNSVHNPRAQYRFPMTPEEVLSDRVVSAPLTRAMCAPIGDGAAAVLVCSRQYLERCSPEARERAVRIRANEIACGVFDVSWEDDRAPVMAARKAYHAAGLSPDDIDLVELHDACSFAEIVLVEDLGLCARGQGGEFVASGATQIDGTVAVNASGGLISRGHPIGATGIMMLNEICVQLRGEAQGNAVPRARLGLAENGGGVIGNDNAVCSVTILEGPGQ